MSVIRKVTVERRVVEMPLWMVVVYLLTILLSLWERVAGWLGG